MGWAVPSTGGDGDNLIDVAVVVVGAAAGSVGHSHGLLTFILFRLPL
jgi:hypothetical protein